MQGGAKRKPRYNYTPTREEADEVLRLLAEGWSSRVAVAKATGRANEYAVYIIRHAFPEVNEAMENRHIRKAKFARFPPTPLYLVAECLQPPKFHVEQKKEEPPVWLPFGLGNKK